MGRVTGLKRNQNGINLKLVHKWRHTLDVGGSGEFVCLPMPTTNELSLNYSVTQANFTVSFRLNGVNGTITVEWPLREIDRSVVWLKTLMPATAAGRAH